LSWVIAAKFSANANLQASPKFIVTGLPAVPTSRHDGKAVGWHV